MPEINLSDATKGLIAITVLVGAIYLQSTQGSIPAWLVTSVSSVLAYYMGFISNQSRKE